MNQDRVVAAVEIGTSKVVVLLGEIIDNSGLNIIGQAVHPSKGVKKGEIVDLDRVGSCVHAAVVDAEKGSDTRIDEVYLAQTGRHLSGFFNTGSSNISASDGFATEIDIEAAKEDAKRRTLPKTRTYIHHIRNPFHLDGKMVDNPIAREGRQLQVGYWSVHGDSEIVSDSLRVIQGLDLQVSDIILSSIASSVVLLEESEKDNGALVIDIGGGTTDYVLYRKGYIVQTGVIPVGGDHITNDLSIGLRIARKNAENLKLKEGRAYFEDEDDGTTVWLYGDLTIGDREYPLGAATRIIGARVAEIFTLIKDELDDADLLVPEDIASGIVLTGGTSQLPGIGNAAEAVFELPVRLPTGPENVAEDLRKPEFSTAIGLLHYALTGQEETQQVAKTTGIIRRIAGLINFR